MITVNRNTKVFVYCPSNNTSGGAELLHQLVSKLNHYLLDAYIVYTEENSEVPQKYLDYKINVSNEIIDDQQNIVIIDEGMFDKAFHIENAQIILWWLSVDNFYYCSSGFLSIWDYIKWKPSYGLYLLLRRTAKLIIKQKRIYNIISLKKIKELNAINCYQSEYAQNFLINNGFKYLAPLTDYINSRLVSSIVANERDNCILYNPKKGLKITRKIIKATPDLKWKPLIGLNQQELLNTYQQSKLYIDFGYHPGKDRIPREAVLNGCCIITGMQGSARFFEDVSIQNYYKIDEKNTSIEDIVDKIQDILLNYETHVDNFEYYKNKIKREQLEFDYQVRNLFNIKNRESIEYDNC